ISKMNKETNEVYFNGSFPYDINDTLRVFAYDPIEVQIQDLTIEGLNTLPAAKFGIGIEYAANSMIKNFHSDNFDHCMTLSYTFGSIIESVTTERSFFTGTSESYGLSVYTGSYTSIRNSYFKSGRHGLEISGFENSFKTFI